MINELLELGLTEVEAIAFKWQFRMMGGFESSLMDAISRADENNLNKIALGFPGFVATFKGWTRGDLAETLKAKMDANPEAFGGRIL